ncbi:MAG: hypothetical protein M1812_003667 [Candelaria pacifica]|nr:MAG: hypothetical protein M1812_003667 [Candelaria pacifica]
MFPTILCLLVLQAFSTSYNFAVVDATPTSAFNRGLAEDPKLNAEGVELSVSSNIRCDGAPLKLAQPNLEHSPSSENALMSRDTVDRLPLPDYIDPIFGPRPAYGFCGWAEGDLHCFKNVGCWLLKNVFAPLQLVLFGYLVGVGPDPFPDQPLAPQLRGAARGMMICNVIKGAVTGIAG